MGINDMIITTADDTDVDKDYFEFIYKWEVLYYAKDISETCECPLNFIYLFHYYY